MTRRAITFLLTRVDGYIGILSGILLDFTLLAIRRRTTNNTNKICVNVMIVFTCSIGIFFAILGDFFAV